MKKRNSMNTIAKTPPPPYYAVIFTSEMRNDSGEGYSETAARMLDLASKQSGFLGFESARSGLGIAVSYWRDLESIRRWKAQREHVLAQQKGRRDWYARYKVRIAKVERDFDYGVN